MQGLRWDMIEWVYGSGFPKSLNIGKAVDKLQGNERESLGIRDTKVGMTDLTNFTTKKQICRGNQRKTNKFILV